MRFVNWRRAGGTAAVAVCVAGLPFAVSAEPLPQALTGNWRITRVLPTSNARCWSGEQARPLVGSTLAYSNATMRWRGGEVPLQGITTRQVTAAQFHKENSTSSGSADFVQLGIHGARVTEVDFQHEDMDITGASTEVPGDSVLLAAPNRIVVSACGVYMEALRTASGSNLQRTSARH